MGMSQPDQSPDQKPPQNLHRIPEGYDVVKLWFSPFFVTARPCPNELGLPKIVVYESVLSCPVVKGRTISMV